MIHRKKKLPVKADKEETNQNLISEFLGKNIKHYLRIKIAGKRKRMRIRKLIFCIEVFMIGGEVKKKKGKFT